MKFITLLFSVMLLFSCGSESVNTQEQKQERIVEDFAEYYEDGKLKIEGELVNGERHGIWKYYFPNGFLWSEGKYWYGKRKGYSLVFYKSGKKRMEGDYLDDEKVGIWTIWKEDGSLLERVDIDSLRASKGKPISDQDLINQSN